MEYLRTAWAWVASRMTRRRWMIVGVAAFEAVAVAIAYYYAGWQGIAIAIIANIAAFGARWLVVNYRRRPAAPPTPTPTNGWFTNAWESIKGFFRDLTRTALVIIVTIGWIVAMFLLVRIAPITAGLLLSFGLLSAVGLFFLPYYPRVIEWLSNQPNLYRPAGGGEITTRDYPKSTFGFFTKIFPGQVKVIERGGRFIRCVMAYDHHMFKGERDDNTLTPKHAEYWENVPTEAPYCDSHPLPAPWHKPSAWWYLFSPFSILWWKWKRHVYNITGYVFTGIPPFQGPRIYPMERFKRVTLANGTVRLDRVEDYSDHYRVAHYQYPVLIADVDTQDKIPVKVLLNVIARVFNAYMTAYNTDDDWPTRFIGSITNAVTAYARPRPLDEVWTATGAANANELARVVQEVGIRPPPGVAVDQNSICAFGNEIQGVQVLDVSPMKEQDERELGEVARARVRRDAKKLDAEGDAARIRETGKALQEAGEALKDHPEALPIAQMEADVQIARAAAAQGNLVFLNRGSSDSDPTQAAILKELRRIGRGKP
jgi:hypothetical protein